MSAFTRLLFLVIPGDMRTGAIGTPNQNAGICC
jgi:hypothetical protein